VFIREVRATIEQASTMDELLRRVNAAMYAALRDPNLLAGESDGVLYRDPTYLFQINAGVQPPGTHNVPHDHGECWAVYGVHTGAMEMTRYERVDDGSDGDFAELRPIETLDCKGGQADVIRPWGIHELRNTSETPAHTFVIRSRNLAEVWRNRFDVDGKSVRRIRGMRLND